MAELALNRGLIVILDDADLPAMARLRWRVQTSSKSKMQYAITGRHPHKLAMMHTLLLSGAGEVDHVNGNGLDNRRCNLRAATRSQNMMNCGKRNIWNASSEFKGVALNKRTGKWFARIRKDYKQMYLGSFATEKEAAVAYDMAAREHFGAFARPNFPY